MDKAIHIVSVVVKLDDNVPEYMQGVLRFCSVTSEDEDGNETEHDDLIDNTEFRSEDELSQHVASALNVSVDLVAIED